MKNKKEKKPKYVDDGHTVYNMDIEGFKWHDRKKNKKADNLKITFRERWAMIRAAFSIYAPIFLIVIAAFSLAIFLMYLWLH